MEFVQPATTTTKNRQISALVAENHRNLRWFRTDTVVRFFFVPFFLVFFPFFILFIFTFVFRLSFFFIFCSEKSSKRFYCENADNDDFRW